MKKIVFFLVLVLCICSCDMINTVYTRVTVEVWDFSPTAIVRVDIDNTQKNVGKIATIPGI